MLRPPLGLAEVYHVIEDTLIRAVPFLPRFDDALVAEFVETEALTLAGQIKIFAGLHLGYDRHD